MIIVCMVMAMGLADPLIYGLALTKPRGLYEKPITVSYQAQVEIGEIVGAEYDHIQKEFVIYATEAVPGKNAVLYVDDVARLGLAVLRYGNFAFSLERVGNQMQIYYLHPQKEAGNELKTILRWTTVEDTLFTTDKILKALAQGDKVDDNLRFGVSLRSLCARELCELGQPMQADFSSTYVTFYQLDVYYRAGGQLMVWYETPKIIVKADNRQEGPAPQCAQSFADGLTSNTEKLSKLSNAKLAGEFRRLKALLLLVKTFGFARTVRVPVDQKLLAAYRLSRVIKNEPFRVKEYPIACREPGDREKVRAFTIHGGILLSANSGQPFLPSYSVLNEYEMWTGLTDPVANQTMNLTQKENNKLVTTGGRGFSVKQVIKDDRKLLRIDLSNILGLRKEIRQ
jgi:hypothetical protein